MDNVATVTANNLPIDVRSIVYYTDPVVENFTTIIEVSDIRNNIVIKVKHKKRRSELCLNFEHNPWHNHHGSVLWFKNYEAIHALFKFPEQES